MFGLLLVAAALLALYRVADLLFVCFIAALIAVYLDAVQARLARVVPLPRPALLLLALVVTLLALGGIVALLAPPVIQQTDELMVAVPRYLSDLDAWIRGVAERYPVLQRAGFASGERGLLSAALIDAADFLRRGIIPYAATTGRILIDGVAVVVMAVYLALRPSLYRDGLIALVPPRHRPAALDLLRDVATSLRAWVVAQLAAMAILGVLTAIGLWLLGIPYWLAFGIFTGLAALVPFFGTLVSTLLPALLVLPGRGLLGFLAVASVGVVVHVIEANIVAPILMHRQVRLPPVLTILSVLVMAELAGPVGLLVAVPTLATVMVVVRHVLLRHLYGDAGEGPGAVPAAGGATPA